LIASRESIGEDIPESQLNTNRRIFSEGSDFSGSIG